MEEKLKKLSVCQAALAARQNPGNRGTEIEIKTNLVKLGLKANVPFYKYDVRVYVVFMKSDGVEVLKELTKQTRDDYSEQERKKGTRAIYQRLLKEQSSFFGNGFALYYDRAAILFSLKELSVGAAKQFDLPNNYITGYNDSTGFRVIIKKVTDNFQTSTNDILKTVSAYPGESDKAILEALNLIVGQVPLMSSDFVTYGNGTNYLLEPDNLLFDQKDTPNLPDGKYTGVGCNQSVKILVGNGSPAAFVTLDIKKTAFHMDDQTLLQKLQDLSVWGRGGRFSPEDALRKMKQILPLLKGLSVYTTYGSKPRFFPIHGLTEHGADMAKHLYNGKNVTVARYFAEKYNIILKYPKLFMVSARLGQNNVVFPVELLKVAPNQRVVGLQQTPDQISQMGVADPKDRWRQTEGMKKIIQLSTTNPYLKQAGFTAEDQFTTVTARLLPAPDIQLGATTASTKVDKNCKWTAKGKFFVATTLSKWMVVALVTERDAAPSLLQDYVHQLVRIGKEKGMNISNPEFNYCATPNEKEVEKYLTQAKASGMQYVFFISADRILLHNFIKNQEALLQIQTQEVKLSKVLSVLQKRQFQTLENVVMKVNAKLGGLSKLVLLGQDAKTRSWISDPNRLFIGFEFSHPAPLTKGQIAHGDTYRAPSVIGFGANAARQSQYFLGDYRYIAAHQPEQLEYVLKEILDTIMRQFKANRNTPPKHIMIYFNGVSEGGFGLVAGTYLDLIRQACTCIHAQFKPALTLIAATKTHNERFYNKVISGVSCTEQNIPAGVVIDKTVVSPGITEFFLNAHCAFKGTAKTPKYSVLYDDAKMPADVVQGMTHGLCYMHDIVNATVSVPTPMLVADRCAKRGANNFVEHFGDITEVTDAIIKEANKLNYKDKKLGNTRYNA